MRKEMLVGFLKGHILFEELIPQELEIVSRRLSVRELDGGELLFSEGDNADFFCLVAQGALDVIKKGKDRHAVTLASLGEGDSVGEMAVIDGMVRSASVRAAYYSIVIVLQRRDFEKILEAYPRIGAKLLKGIARHISVNLRRTSSELTDLMMPIA